MFDLHRHDEFSFYDGSGKAKELAKIAKEKGLSGTYHLLKYNDWELDSEKSIFTENKNREGKGKKVILCKNNEIEQFYFEDRIGGTIEIKYIDESEKQYLIQLYKSYLHSTE